ncbi:phosphotransferase system component [Seminavis robusta]|uniref:Phosphotransferase system component n=1 Tax=Seminavis robusta TaxID=568900 RepID=A0A9N8HNB0_9STRA|nr:phosphotransferase system component [Seminavis robusta]|eukprot:Sro971_g226480.1 phosphotransferase system component (717) ;mRNA; f:25487-28106
MTSLGLDLGVGVGNIPSNAAAVVFGNSALAMNGDEYVRCLTCGYGGCDIRVSGCGCTLHARCLRLKPGGPMTACPHCNKPSSGLVLFPMSFREIDEAKKTSNALQNGQRNRGRKRKSEGPTGLEEKGGYVSERRTGRWTVEEMTYCDKLIEKFESGEMPIVNGIKLNEFLGNMLKSKQSRLTKKMKNAKLSTKTFQRTIGYLHDVNEAREFSELEESFYNAIQDLQERAEIKFHMQREWREQFSQFCVSIGQPLDADGWLSSVEEMDRRASSAQNAARMTRRKMMMGFALRTDCRNPDQGVFIEKTEDEQIVAEHTCADGDQSKEADIMMNFLSERKAESLAMDMNGKSSLLHSAPFLAKTISYLQRHNVPFEHVDLWVPSFVPTSGMELQSGEACRLCYAGSATVDKQVDQDGKNTRSLTSEEQFNLFAFGDYSQKFSFDVGCGLPGRVYESGRPTWEQSVHNAPHNHFERCGGALQWGIKTVLGIPIASPNVGRIVVTLYSCHDRPKDQELVARLMDEFTRLLPSPKWKLVVDIGEPEESPAVSAAASTVAADTNSAGMSNEANDGFIPNNNTAPVPAGGKDARIDDVVSLLGEYMPSDPSSTMAPYLSGFMSLRLLFLRPSRTAEEEELARTMLDSYSSYSAGGRSRSDIAVMLARDFMFLSQQQQQQVAPPAPQQVTQQNGYLGIAQQQQQQPQMNAPAPSGTTDSLSIVSN